MERLILRAGLFCIGGLLGMAAFKATGILGFQIQPGSFFSYSNIYGQYGIAFLAGGITFLVAGALWKEPNL